MKILFENDIAVATAVKNESTYIGEWLEYHYKIGVDKFYIYDNDSEDRSELMKVLEPWIRNQIVEYTEMPGDYVQLPVYQNAVHRHRFDCRYLAFIDVDEYIVPKNNVVLRNLLDQIFAMKTDPNFLTAALCVNWRTFGSNGHLYRESGGVLERFPKRLKDDFHRNLVVKSITNPRRIHYCFNPHYLHLHMNCRTVNENGNPVDGFENAENTVEKIQLNHYFTKSKEEFMQKVSRGRPESYQRYDENLFAEYDDRDEIEDLEALEIFCRPIFPRKHIISEKLTIRDLELMLSESEHDFEQLLTCFHRANGLKNSDQRLEFLSMVSSQILQMNYLPIYDFYLLFEAMPEIISAKTAFTKQIIEIYLQISPYVEADTRKSLLWFELDELQKKRELLQALI